MEVISSMADSCAVILSTHILPEVSMTCQKVVILDKGKALAWGTPNHLRMKYKHAMRVE